MCNGSIKSPNFPENYPEKIKCIWTFKAPPKMNVLLEFEKFHVRI